MLPTSGCVLLTVSGDDKSKTLEVAKQFKDMGFTIKATQGTRQFLADNGIDSDAVLKMHEGRPNIADSIKNNEIQLVINIHVKPPCKITTKSTGREEVVCFKRASVARQLLLR